MTEIVDLYGRQSHGDDRSIEDQLDDGRDRAREQGWEVGLILRDEVSASRHAHKIRDDWPRLIERVQQRATTIVWLWEASRGDRTASTWLAFLDALEANKVRLYIDKDEQLYDLSRARDWKYLATEGINAQGESDLIKERTMRSKNRARDRGELKTVYGGRARFGWRDPGPGQQWEVDPPTAKVLRDVAARLLRGEELLPIWRELTEAGPLLDSYGEPMTIKRLRKAVQSPIAAGLMTRPDGTVIGRVVDNAPLTEQAWRDLSADFAGRKRGRPAGDRFPLGRLLVCGKCGNQLTGEMHTGQVAYYGCTVPHKQTGHEVPCRGVWVRVADLHRQVRDGLQTWAEESPRAHRLAAEKLDTTSARRELEAEWGRLQDRMSGLESKRDRNRISPAQFREHEAVIESGFARLEKELTVLKQAEAEAQAGIVPLDIDWDELTGPERRTLVAEVFETPIVVRPRVKGEARVRLTLRD